MEDYTKVIPCLDLQNPLEAAKFYNDSGADEIAYFDSKATKEGRETNIEMIREIARVVDIPLLVCGGIKKLEDVKKALYAGASKVCINSAAVANKEIVREISERFGSDRLIVAIDLTVMEEPIEWAKEVVRLGAGEILLIHNNQVPNYIEIVKEIKKVIPVPVIVSSYSTEPAELADMVLKTEAESISLYNLDKMDIMEIKQKFAEEHIEVNTFQSEIPFEEFQLNEEGLIPCIVQDYKTAEVLMMAYMNQESYEETIRSGRMTYYSRSREKLWKKGETSGNFQYVKSLTIDCDKDTLLAKVSQVGVACHTGSRSCFFTNLVQKEYDDTNPLTVFEDVFHVIQERKEHPKEGSYTNYLFEKGIDKILKKIGEECTEIVIAAKNPDTEEIKYEISDFLYHLMVLMAERGLEWKDITKELAERR
ncbi:MAG TPA: bifunctional phosphoribosyl-AMP cyclohydrolase/phosphoribosyl-ATP diphosphatase HisIE [Candidatus Scybalomonas excrementigallinarum]|nr:bifunctional phosphoribosyl-AMP cyclohydrolase/phosphoribosyl-ATP diphosphatase HisIE [Candidatus Scybalomonas excrementigallinarum]